MLLSRWVQQARLELELRLGRLADLMAVMVRHLAAMERHLAAMEHHLVVTESR